MFLQIGLIYSFLYCLLSSYNVQCAPGTKEMHRHSPACKGACSIHLHSIVWCMFLLPLYRWLIVFLSVLGLLNKRAIIFICERDTACSLVSKLLLCAFFLVLKLGLWIHMFWCSWSTLVLNYMHFQKDFSRLSSI